MTRGVLPLALRAAPRSKFAPGEFVEPYCLFSRIRMLFLYYCFGPSKRAKNNSGGEGGIRTLEGLLTLTPLAGERFQPLSHLSESVFSRANSGTTSINAVGSGTAALAVIVLKVSPHQPAYNFAPGLRTGRALSTTQPPLRLIITAAVVRPAKGAHLTEWVTGGKAEIRG